MSPGVRPPDSRPLSVGAQTPWNSGPTKVQREWAFEASSRCKDFLVSKEGCTLRAWVQQLDPNFDGFVCRDDFIKALARLHYIGDGPGLFDDIDLEGTGDIELSDIDSGMAALASEFRRFCASNVDGAGDLFRACRGQPGKAGKGDGDPLPFSAFRDGMRRLGWDFGCVRLIFDAFVASGHDCLYPRDFRWLDAEARRFRVKELVRTEGVREQNMRAAAKAAARAALRDFKSVLRRTFGPLYHAWRRLLDVDGRFAVAKADVYKACRQLNWKGDLRGLWRALDFDNSGSTTIDEFDPKTAQTLAFFYHWASTTFGTKPSALVWRAIDPLGRSKLKYPQFIRGCQSRGFDHRLKLLASLLDWQGKQVLTKADLGFLDTWSPQPWGFAKPNEHAASEFKRQLRRRYHTLLRGWHLCLDQDSSNDCNWHEFLRAARVLKFTGDVPGAWAALDVDINGSISFKEVDEAAYILLMQFKAWATAEYGGVRCAFTAMDADRSRSLCFREFRRALRCWGYPGSLSDIRILFVLLLDRSGDGLLQLDELVFLDHWDAPDSEATRSVDMEESLPGLADSREPPADSREAPSMLLEYGTDNPGPGTYEVRSALGATPSLPMSKHAGAFSMQGRRDWVHAGAKPILGPAYYKLDPQASSVHRRKPAWGFTSTPRPGHPTETLGSKRNRPASVPSPGPGAYEAKSCFQGPQFSMGGRWGVRVHPRQPVRLTSPRTVPVVEQ